MTKTPDQDKGVGVVEVAASEPEIFEAKNAAVVFSDSSPDGVFHIDLSDGPTEMPETIQIKISRNPRELSSTSEERKLIGKDNRYSGIPIEVGRVPYSVVYIALPDNLSQPVVTIVLTLTRSAT